MSWFDPTGGPQDTNVERAFDSLSGQLGRRGGVDLRRTTDVAIANGASYVVSWETAAFDSGDGFWFSGTNLNIDREGLYAMTFQTDYTATSIIRAFIDFSVRLKGSPRFEEQNGIAAGTGPTVTIVEWLHVGDTFNCFVINNSGGSRTLNNAWLQLHRLQ